MTKISKVAHTKQDLTREERPEKGSADLTVGRYSSIHTTPYELRHNGIGYCSSSVRVARVIAKPSEPTFIHLKVNPNGVLNTSGTILSKRLP